MKVSSLLEFRWMLLLAAGLLLGSWQVQAQSRESDVKAAFLFNFAQFVEWPTNAFPTNNAPLIIGVIGTDPFGSALDEIVRGEKVQDHPLEVRRFRQVSEARHCHILFISKSEAANVTRILRVVQGRPILTVSDLEGFAHEGGMIQLFTAQNRVKIRVNIHPAREAGLTLSSKLLRVAEVLERD